MPLRAVPSSQLVQIDAAEETTTATSPTKLKEIVITYPGTYRVKFNMKVETNTAGYAAIYVNATRRGTVREDEATAGDYDTYVQDIGGLEENDLLQIYAWHTNGTGTTYVDGLELLASYGNVPDPLPAGNVTA